MPAGDDGGDIHPRAIPYTRCAAEGKRAPPGVRWDTGTVFERMQAGVTVNKRTWCYGTGALVVAAGAALGGTFAFRQWAGTAPAPAVASAAPAINNKVDTILDLVRAEKTVSVATTQPAATTWPVATTRPAAAAAPVTHPASAARGVPAARGLLAEAGKTGVSVRAPAAAPAPAGRLTHDERVVLATVSQLQFLRGAVETWKLQHDGRAPDFAKFPMWQQFTQRDERGQALGGTPVNPLNGESRVLPVQGDVRAGLTIKGGSFGYVYSMAGGKLWATDEAGAIFDDAAVDTLALEMRAVKELSPQAAKESTLAVLASLRTQIQLYQLQHDERVPNFARYPAFEQLTKRTYPDGRIADEKAATHNAPGGRRVVGPYLPSVPVNALNGKYKVAVVNGGVQPSQRAGAADAGFVYSVALRKLFATDASGRVLDDGNVSVTDRAASGGQGAAPMVQALYSQIVLYKLQHDDAVPDLNRYPKWEQLTSRTRTDGTPDPAGKHGPYLKGIPVNPRNNSSDVEVVERIPDGWRPTKKVGFVFESSTCRLWLTDERWAPVANQ
jgi:competence protein ComGC